MYRYVSMILHKLLDLKIFPDDKTVWRGAHLTNLNPRLIFTPLPVASPPAAPAAPAALLLLLLLLLS